MTTQQTSAVSNPPTGTPRIRPLYVYVDNVDEHFRKATAAGANIVIELANRPWGDRSYQAADVEGHQWTFAQHIEDVELDICSHEETSH